MVSAPRPFLLIALICLVSVFMYGNQFFAPSHESKIILIGQHEDNIFTLDSNGLLRQQDLVTNSLGFTIPVRSFLHYAFFYYPYIVMVDYSNSLYVYDIQNKFVRFEDSFSEDQEKTSVTFSNDLSLFSYLKNSSLHILNTDSWNTLRSIHISSPAVFSVISQNTQNIMTYQSNGNIEYHNIYNGKLLRSVKTSTTLESFVLNTTFRYGVGYSGNSIISIDVITGEIADSIMFLNNITHSYKDYVDESHVYFNIVSKINESSEHIKNFSIDKDGNLRENDLFNITNQNKSSYILGNGTNTFVGFDNGELWSYERNKQNLDKTILVQDDTLAIYDAIYKDSNLIMLNYNSIITLPFNINNSIPSSLRAHVSSQSLQYPSFISVDKWIDNSHTKSELHILSSDTPYSYTIPNTVPYTSNFPSIFKPIPFNTLRNNSPTLLFRLNNNLQAISPQSFAPHINRVESSGNLTLLYSTNESTFYIKDNKDLLQMPLLAPRHIFKTSSTDQFSGTAQSQNIIWTNTPLDASASKIVADRKTNILYTYSFADGILEEHFPPLELSFLNEDIFDFDFISLDPYILFVTSIDEAKKTSNFYLVRSPFTSNYAQDNKDSEYPFLVQKLFDITSAPPLKIKSLDKNKDVWMVFTNDSIYIIKINLADSQFDFVYTTRYPNMFGLFQNAQVSEISSEDNSRTTNKYIVTMVDKNNSILVMGLSELYQLSILTSFIIKNDNSLEIYTDFTLPEN